MFFVLSRAWDKENIRSPHEESNLTPSDSAADALEHGSAEYEGLKLFSISLSKCPGSAFVLFILFLLRKNDLEFDNLFTE